MRAAVITAPGGPEVLSIADRPVPRPGADDVLVRVRSSAINRADVLQRLGRYPAPPGVPADIPGLEFAGEVAALGPGASLWSVGDRVCGLVGGGAHAEYLVTHERALAAVPDGLSWAQAGAAPEACVTAWDALRQADARPGDVVLVHAVGSGVGLAVVQLARQLGCRVFGTARGEAKLAAARDAGMEDGALAGSPGWLLEASKRWVGKRGVDVVIDLVGGDYVRESLPAMALRGRVVVVGTLAGVEAAVDLRTLLSRRLVLRGTVLRSRPLEERIMVVQQFGREVLPWLAAGRVAMRLDATFPLERIAEAHALMESNATIGKVALAFG
jgi:putative PIG3 family NAD(P)H quinone oxidoreductase